MAIPPVVEPPPPPPRSASRLLPTLHYCLRIDTHVYAFAIAANVLLSFFPFMVLILSLAQNLLHWKGAVDVIYASLRDHLPEDPGLVEFVIGNLRATVDARGHVELLSVFLLILSSNGIFIPLEVALNRLWGIPKDRSYVWNQIISFGMAFVCGTLALCGAVLASIPVQRLTAAFGLSPGARDAVTLVALKLAAFPLTILLFFLVYGVLPNGRVPRRRVVRAAVLVGVTVEAAKALYLLVWPLLDFRRAYGPFFISVTLLVWGYLSAMIVLAGGELASRGWSDEESAP